ncbi:MAG: hypothetical protein QOF62_1015 [Pyrinomonadaceae bacterium]|jgi:hypothetical protein|nr:hypothetical protein [Pyrinomonadaceae bacterium]
MKGSYRGVGLNELLGCDLEHNVPSAKVIAL